MNCGLYTWIERAWVKLNVGRVAWTHPIWKKEKRCWSLVHAKFTVEICKWKIKMDFHPFYSLSPPVQPPLSNLLYLTSNGRGEEKILTPPCWCDETRNICASGPNVFAKEWGHRTGNSSSHFRPPIYCTRQWTFAFISFPSRESISGRMRWPGSTMHAKRNPPFIGPPFDIHRLFSNHVGIICADGRRTTCNQSR